MSFEARRGEILGIAGVQGNGQTELIKSLLRCSSPTPARSSSRAATSPSTAPRRASRPGSATSPRTARTTATSAPTVRENLVLDLYRNDFSKGLALKLDAIAANAGPISEFDIRTEDMDTPVSALSGGDQQKVVVARELSRPLKVLVASQPTRGVDVGSIEFIHKRIITERDNGTAIIIVSTELDEIFALSDRIAVMYDGRIVGVVSPDIAREDIGLMMAGAGKDVHVTEATDA